MGTGTYDARKAMHKCVSCGRPVDEREDGTYPVRCDECVFRYVKKHAEHAQKPQSLCWDCENAVPKVHNGKYVQGCDWSIRLQPVKGWDASGRLYNPVASGDIRITYLVRSCPLFRRTKRRKGVPIDEEI